MRQKKKLAKKKVNKILNQEAVRYAFKEGYRIYPVTKDNVNYQIEVSKAHQKALLTKFYNKNNIHDGVIACYDMVFEKRKDI